jgi:hypothetical protein
VGIRHPPAGLSGPAGGIYNSGEVKVRPPPAGLGGPAGGIIIMVNNQSASRRAPLPDQRSGQGGDL